MKAPIVITPDFNHPLRLHNLEYEQLTDPVEGGSQYVLVLNEQHESRWAKRNTEERSLDDAAHIAANTASFLLQLGMNPDKDEVEQDEWLVANPPHEYAKDSNRLPNGLDAVEILKIIGSSIRNNVIYNMPEDFLVEKGCYKEVKDETGKLTKVPYLDIDIEVSGKRIRTAKPSENYGLNQNPTRTNKPPIPPQDIYSSRVALKLAALLNEYDKQIVQDSVQLRTYITNKLIDISNCGNTKDELRALELLGKHSDVGLFVEKTEISVVNTTPAALEHAIKDKINRLLGYANIEMADGEFTEAVNREPVELEVDSDDGFPEYRLSIDEEDEDSEETP
jgi:hypothetical protein